MGIHAVGYFKYWKCLLALKSVDPCPVLVPQVANHADPPTFNITSASCRSQSASLADKRFRFVTCVADTELCYTHMWRMHGGRVGVKKALTNCCVILHFTKTQIRRESIFHQVFPTPPLIVSIFFKFKNISWSKLAFSLRVVVIMYADIVQLSVDVFIYVISCRNTTTPR